MSQFDRAVHEIIRTVSLVQVVSNHVSLKKTGRVWKGLCPFHSEKTPSFNVDEDKKLFYCFGCQTGGNAFTFLKHMGLSGSEAMQKLAEMANIPLPKGGYSDPKDDAAARRKSDMMHAIQVSQEYFQGSLGGSSGSAARGYLEQRGISPETTQLYGLGFGGDGRGLLAELSRRKVSMEVAEDVGVIIRSNHGSGWYERFRGRLVCPVFNLDGAPIAFSARQLPGDDYGPKYHNSPESIVYTKGNTLFGLLQARGAIRNEKSVIVVEGNFDVLAMASAGLKHVVAPLGSAITENQIRMLRRFTDKVVICFDGDKAGRNATHGAIPTLINAGIDGAVVELADGEDPDSIIKNVPLEEAKRTFGRAQPMVSYYLNSEVQAHGLTPHGKKKVIEAAQKLFVSEKDPFVYGQYIEELARLLSIEVKDVRYLIRSPQGSIEKTQVGGCKTPNVERILLELLLVDYSLIERYLQDDFEGELLTDNEARDALALIISSYIDEQGDGDPCDAVVSAAMDSPSISLTRSLAEALVGDGLHPNPSKEYEQILVRLRQEQLQRKEESLLILLTEANACGQDAEATRLAMQLAENKRAILALRRPHSG